VFEEEVHGVVAAHAAARREYVRAPAEILDEGDDFVDDVGIVVVVSAGTIGRVRGGVEPRLVVGATDGNEADSSGVNETANGIDHSEAFKFFEAAAGGRKNENWFAIMSVDIEGHIVTERGAVPLEILFAHEGLQS